MGANERRRRGTTDDSETGTLSGGGGIGYVNVGRLSSSTERSRGEPAGPTDRLGECCVGRTPKSVRGLIHPGWVGVWGE